MPTIPASVDVRVIPNVLNAGGRSLVLNGLFLTKSARIPVGAVSSYPNPLAVSAVFGPTSPEYAMATVYFNGYNGCTQLPSSLLMAQYPAEAVSAYLRSGPITGYTLAQIQAMQGSLSVVFDGATYSAPSLNLSAATSYSAAGALIQQALNTNEQQDASFTGVIAPASVTFSGSIVGPVLTVNSVPQGAVPIVNGAIVTGPGIAAGTNVTGQIAGTPGGAGTYSVDVEQVVGSESMTASYGVLTVSAVASGTLSVGQTPAGTGVAAGTLVTGLGTGTGLTGTYYVVPSQTVASEAMTTQATPITVGFDSVSGSLTIASGDPGSQSTAAYATGSLAAPLRLTAATGAVTSQGADAAVPGPYMDQIVQTTQNWACFTTCFDPDDGGGNSQKLAFAKWTNAQLKRYAYVAEDTDLAPIVSTAASASLGALVNAAEYDGTWVQWRQVADGTQAAFVCGIAASLDFGATNGRATFKFRYQDGLIADVTNALVAANLKANGYNCLGAVGTANENFVYLREGTVSGVFDWMDSYVNEIYLNSQLQLALIELLQNVGSIPYDADGYALCEAVCADPIAEAINFGTIRIGVPLSNAQAAKINNAAGLSIAKVVTSQGYYLQFKAPTAQVRAGRGTPIANLWYADGQSIHTIVLNSVDVQ